MFYFALQGLGRGDPVSQVMPACFMSNETLHT